MKTSPFAKDEARPAGFLQRLEDAFLASLLLVMIVLAALQIFLRDLLGGGIGWVDPMLRVLVLWVGLLGALAASRDDRHITIDVVSRLLPGRMRSAVGVLTSLCTAGVTGLIAYHSVRFVASELEYGSVAFSGVPAWLLQAVIPFAFGAIALRSLRRAALHGRAALHPPPAEEADRDEAADAGER